jgi:hypothetical protein
VINDLDQYEKYYADKLWNLMPAVYRAEDADKLDALGPLRELVNRIGAQAAVLRRSLDRMLEDQSIETCDDWIIPYIGDLLATNLVSKLDARGQRLDVANTIYYRRRKGTVANLEEIALDITGWDAKVVEFFRRLGRMRHGLDPAIGLAGSNEGVITDATDGSPIVITSAGHGLSTGDKVTVGGVTGNTDANGTFTVKRVNSDQFSLEKSRGNRMYVSGGTWHGATTRALQATAALQRAEGLVGSRTRTPIGGFGDLRNVYGASKAHTAFDEFFHTADFRVGRGKLGWHNIPRLGVFLWRLQSFGVKPTTPVAVSSINGDDCYGWFTFDPTGRDIPLIAASRPSELYGDKWVSPVESRLPSPISQQLFDSPDEGIPLYPESLSVLPKPPADGEDAVPIPLNKLTIRPERGRFFLPGAVPPTLCTTYHYGFSSSIGAGPYDRRGGSVEPLRPDPQITRSGGGEFDKLPRAGTVTIDDSLTYQWVDNLSVDGVLTIRAAILDRPVLRVTTAWTIEGTGKTANCLTLDGLLLSGADVILQGRFECVTITCCTLDPGKATPRRDTESEGEADVSSSPYARAADGAEIVPCRLWIEGTVGTLKIERSITGPICAGGCGRIETLLISDSIVQDILNVYDTKALEVDNGEVVLTRCTILGKIVVHRLQASDCILQDIAKVDDTQYGCIRFSAFADDSTLPPEYKNVLPRQYESVRIKPGAELFVSEDFGQPDYCQLIATVDAAILPAAGVQPPAPSISSGAEDGSEMGAFARDMGPQKQRALLLKYQEFMPAGLVPVLIYVT